MGLRSALSATGEVGNVARAQPDKPLEELVSPSNCAFFFDVDGTLIDLAARPDLVVVPAALSGNLAALAERAGGALALVSGRAVSALDALFPGVDLAMAGVHGGEIRRRPGEDVHARSAPLDAALRERLGDVADRFRLLMEDKGSSVALHYRADPSVAPAVEAELARLVARMEGVGLLKGHFVFELRRAGHDKGTAIAAFMEEAPFRGRRPVFLGDDVTDEAGFAVVRAMGGLAVSVGAARPGAHLVLPDAASVRALLARLAL